MSLNQGRFMLLTVTVTTRMALLVVILNLTSFTLDSLIQLR